MARVSRAGRGARRERRSTNTDEGERRARPAGAPFDG